MYPYLITPHAPLVLRSGRPIDATTGHDTFSFPFPSTLAGALRAACADNQQLDFEKERARIENWRCAGPLLAVINEKNQATPLFPKPQDVYYTRPDNQLLLHALKPKPLNADEGWDLDEDGLLPVFLDNNTKDKPVAGPTWWNLDAIIAWLWNNNKLAQSPVGYDALPQDARLHTALNRETLSSKAGLLYQSSGTDFEAQRQRGQSKWLFDFTNDPWSARPSQNTDKYGWQAHRFALLARFEQQIPDTLLRLGGEGRLSALENQADAWPNLPDSLKKHWQEQLKATKYLRLLLVTPALFSQGWRPGWLDDTLAGECPAVPDLHLKLRAAAIDRWQAISGWDIRAKKPKAIRRLAPAGSVYWFEIAKMPPTDWLEKLWLNSISDDPKDRNNGFGLVLPGLWT